MVTERDEKVLASLAMLGTDDASPGQDVAGLRLRLHRLRTDPTEAARIEALAAGADQSISEDQDAGIRGVQLGKSGEQSARGRVGSAIRRRQSPLPDAVVSAVSAELQRQREQAGLTYRDLADIAGYSLATVTAACGGRRLPSWKATRAIVEACGGDADAMRGLYEQACTAEGRPLPESAEAVTDPPDPAEAETPEQLVACMARLRSWAGSPSLAKLNLRSGGHLPPTTISGVLRRKSLPRRDLVMRYA